MGHITYYYEGISEMLDYNAARLATSEKPESEIRKELLTKIFRYCNYNRNTWDVRTVMNLIAEYEEEMEND
jgi:hypothetical protein